jgi:hypothetical protein
MLSNQPEERKRTLHRYGREQLVNVAFDQMMASYDSTLSHPSFLSAGSNAMNRWDKDCHVPPSKVHEAHIDWFLKRARFFGFYTGGKNTWCCSNSTLILPSLMLLCAVLLIRPRIPSKRTMWTFIEKKGYKPSTFNLPQKHNSSLIWLRSLRITFHNGILDSGTTDMCSLRDGVY